MQHEGIEYLETKGIEAWQAKRDGKGEVAMEEVERGRVVRVEGGDGGCGKRVGVDTDRSLHASEGTG